MSNAEKMVSEDLIRAILGNAAQGYFSKDHGDQLRAILAQPAQHQAEPVTLPARHVHEHHGCFLSERQHGWNACLDEIAKLGPLYPHPAQGGPVAWQCSESGSILRINKAHGSYTIPLYTHADPGELAILLRQTQVRNQGVINSLECELADLRAQLADHQALLRRINDQWKVPDPTDQDRECWDAIDAALGCKL